MIRHVHDFEAETSSLQIEDNGKDISLSIRIEPESYSFFVEDKLVDSCSYAGLTTGCALGNCFTGTLLGVFAENGKAVFKDGLNLS